MHAAVAYGRDVAAQVALRPGLVALRHRGEPASARDAASVHERAGARRPTREARRALRAEYRGRIQDLGVRRKKNFFSRLEPRAARLLRNARVAHLATADRRGRPHVVPICFAIDGDNLITPLDAKPKKSAPLNLKR